MKIPQVDRDRLIDAFNHNQDYITLAEQLGIKRQTARNIIVRFQQNGRRNILQRGSTHIKVTEHMVAAMVEYVEQKPTITLKEIRQKLIVNFPHNEPITVQTISKHLDSQLISLKKLDFCPIQWNTQEVKRERHEFMEWYVNDGMLADLVFQDETGFNLYTSRQQGRALRGQPAVRILEGQRGQNLTLSMAISPTLGLIHHQLYRGGMNRDRFAGFLVEIGELLPESDIQILMDNAPAHRSAEDQVQYEHSVKRLPRYSPFLNIVELANSAVKAETKRRLSDPNIQRQIQDRNAAEAARITLQEHRMQILWNIVDEAVAVVTPHKAQQWFQHTLTYTIRCVNEEDIFA